MVKDVKTAKEVLLEFVVGDLEKTNFVLGSVI